MFKFLFSKKKNLAVYNENRMSPFDAFALEKLVSSFGKHDRTCLEIGSWFGAGSTQIIGKFSKELVCVDHWQGDQTLIQAASQLMLDVYDISQDDLRFKQEAHGPEQFRYIRKHYPIRREFSAIAVNTGNFVDSKAIYALGFLPTE